MKNLFIAACAFAVLAFTSCQKEDIADNKVDAKTFDVELQTNMNAIANNLDAFDVLSNSPMQSQSIQKTPNMTGVAEYPFVTELTIYLVSNVVGVSDIELIFAPVAGVLTCATNIPVGDPNIPVGDPNHTVNPDGSIYLHNIPVGNYTITITATNGHDVEVNFASTYNGQFAFHADYSEYDVPSQLGRAQILNWIQSADDLSTPYPQNENIMSVPVRKDWVSEAFTTAVPALPYVPHMFELRLQNDLFAMLVHRDASDRIRINSYIMLNEDYVPDEENLKSLSIASYYNCQNESHTDFLTAFQDEVFSMLWATPIDVANYSLFMVVTDPYDAPNFDNIGCIRIPLEEIIGGKVHFAEILIDRTSVRIKNLSLSFESFAIDEWTEDIFVNGEISVIKEWPLTAGVFTVADDLGL